MRSENEKRIQAFIDAASEERSVQRQLQQRNKEQDNENRRARSLQAELLYSKRRNDVAEMQMEKQQLAKIMLSEQERELKLKQKRREEVRRSEENAKLRKEEERRENERRVKEIYDKKAEEEEREAIHAEKLVRMLEKKEKEWITKLQYAQSVQQRACENLEVALIPDESADIAQLCEVPQSGNASLNSSSGNSQPVRMASASNIDKKTGVAKLGKSTR